MRSRTVDIVEVPDVSHTKNENFWFITREADGTFYSVPKSVAVLNQNLQQLNPPPELNLGLLEALMEARSMQTI